MKALVTAGSRFSMTPDGSLWASRGDQSYGYWARYLDVYDEISLLVRANPVDREPSESCLASGHGVRPVVLPYYEGPWQFSRKKLKIERLCSRALTGAEGVHLRLPCPIASTLWTRLKRGRPYGVEVLGDPREAFAPGAVKHPARAYFRWLFARQLRFQCASACAVSYVTENALQRRYPAAPEAFATHCSDVLLADSDFVAAPRCFPEGQRAFTLITVTTLAQLYKGPDVLISAVSECVKGRLDVRLVFVGDGKHRRHLESKTEKLGLTERIRFAGNLAFREAVRAELDRADLFVLPSRQEGLPKAMVEAMARALPCIGSRVGGIPELLPSADLVPPGDPLALAAKIRDVLTCPQRLERMSAYNLDKAKGYRDSTLCVRRREFYRYVRSRTEEWSRGELPG